MNLTWPTRAGGRAGTSSDVMATAVLASRVVVAAAVVIGLAAPDRVERHAAVVLALGFAVGLPHGAIDHLLPARHRWLGPGRLRMVVLLAGYLATAALSFLGLVLATDVVLPLLLAVSVLHFGYGDLTALRGRPPTWDGARSTIGGLVDAVARGAPILAGPLLCWPSVTGRAFGAMGWTDLPSRRATLLVAGALLAVSVVGVLRAWVAGQPASALEIVLLAALFVLLTPLAAFGVYFGAWHGLRHTARLLADDPASRADLLVGRWGRPLVRFGRAAAVPSAAAVVVVVALGVVAADHNGLVAPVFAVLLALSVPHVVVVGWWDLCEGTPAPANRELGPHPA